jgi:transmembrane sensor
MLNYKMTIQDLLADECFINYCKGAPAKDVDFWKDYLLQHPEHVETAELAREKFLFLFNAMAHADLMEQEARLIEKLNNPEQATILTLDGSRPANTRKRTILLRLAVAATLVALVSTVVFRTLHTQDKKEGRLFATANGERKNIQLSDGTIVNLNAGSVLRMDPAYGISTREIYLEGEAFFDVKHNRKLPFIVHTDEMDVKALGTAFDVRAYRDEKITETALIRGSIEVTLKENHNRKMVLSPNHKIAWNKSKQHIVSVDSVAAAPASVKSNYGIPQEIVVMDRGEIKEIAWKENRLVFENELFSDIAMLLERWYGVKLVFTDDEIRNYRFTGLFEKEDLQAVLNFLKESRPFHFKIENNETVTVYLSK